MQVKCEKPWPRQASTALNAADVNMHMGHQLARTEQRRIDSLTEKKLEKDCSLEPDLQSNVTFKYT
jgi:hypothetical protein